MLRRPRPSWYPEAAYAPTELLRRVYWASREGGKGEDEAWAEAELAYRVAVQTVGPAQPARVPGAPLSTEIVREPAAACLLGFDAWLAEEAARAAEEAAEGPQGPQAERGGGE